MFNHITYIIIMIIVLMTGCKGANCQLVTGTNDIWASSPTQKIELKINFSLDK